MQLILAHWHCILPVLIILVAMIFMRDKDKEKKDGNGTTKDVTTILQNDEDKNQETVNHAVSWSSKFQDDYPSYILLPNDTSHSVSEGDLNRNRLGNTQPLAVQQDGQYA